MKNPTNLTAEQAYEFFAMGEADAKGLEIGKPFVGAFGAASVRGLRSGTVEFRLFVSGFMFALESSEKGSAITTDSNGIIVSFR